MVSGRLRLYGTNCEELENEEVHAPPTLQWSALSRVERSHLRDREGVAYAGLYQAERLRALWLSRDHLHPGMLELPIGRRRARGRWLTHSVQLGSFTPGRIFQGPGLFVRQIDLGGPGAGLNQLVLRLPDPLPARDRSLGRDAVYEWMLGGQRFIYVARGSSWALYGAGNTPELRLETVLRTESPASGSALLWAIGAVRLAAPPPDKEQDPAS